MGEETVYGGFLLVRMNELIPDRWRAWVPVLASSVLFELAHSEQGVVGVSLSSIEGRRTPSRLWAVVSDREKQIRNPLAG